MLTIVNFIAISIAFNVLFFMYAYRKMNNKLSPVKTTLFSVIFSVPLSFLLIGFYTLMLGYSVYMGASEEDMWEYLEAENQQAV